LRPGRGVPPNYLVQILIELKAQGIARSVRGKEGGYLLGRAPSEITLGDVLRAVHGEMFDTPALSDPNCAPELRKAWLRLKIPPWTKPPTKSPFSKCSTKAPRRKRCITSEALNRDSPVENVGHYSNNCLIFAASLVGGWQAVPVQR